MIEWPPGSGRKAEYTDAELQYMKGFVRQKEAGEITSDSLKLQISHLHDLKMEFGIDIVQAELNEQPKPPTGGKVTGKYFGHDATATEQLSGIEVELADQGPLKPGGAGHTVLQVFGDGERRTAYDASFEAVGDFHARRREATRLLERGFLVKDGTLPNKAVNGRPHVDAYRITQAGLDELVRLSR